MVIAAIVLSAALASAPREPVQAPCSSRLCQISPFFCPGAYPRGMAPCEPVRPQPRPLPPRRRVAPYEDLGMKENGDVR